MHKGLTTYVVFGRYGGFGYRRDGNYFRVVLGWVCFAVGLTDLERDVAALVEQATRDRAELNQLKFTVKQFEQAYLKVKKQLDELKKIRKKLDIRTH